MLAFLKSSRPNICFISYRNLIKNIKSLSLYFFFFTFSCILIWWVFGLKVNAVTGLFRLELRIKIMNHYHIRRIARWKSPLNRSTHLLRGKRKYTVFEELLAGRVHWTDQLTYSEAKESIPFLKPIFFSFSFPAQICNHARCILRSYNIVVYETIDWRHYAYMSILHFVTCTMWNYYFSNIQYLDFWLFYSSQHLSFLYLIRNFPWQRESVPLKCYRLTLKAILHYENMPIQIYRNFHLQKLKIFR